MNGATVESPLWLPEKYRNAEMMQAVRSMSELIKSLSIGRKDSLFNKTRYLSAFEVDGSIFRLVYYPKTEKTEGQEERPEKFILVKRSSIDLTDEIGKRGVLNYGFTLRITSDIQDQDRQNISNIQLFPENIANIVEVNDMNPKFKLLGDEWVHLLFHSTTESNRFLPLDDGRDEQKHKVETKYYPKASFINGLIHDLSQIPLLA